MTFWLRMQREHAFTLLKGVRDELDTARVAIAQSLREMGANAEFLRALTRNGVGEGELKRCAKNLEVTYVLRLFSEFEAILRDYWSAIGRKSKPQIGTLINRVAAIRKIAPADLSQVHDVRDFRNDVIHENVRNMRLSFDVCKRNIGIFIKWLPVDW